MDWKGFGYVFWLASVASLLGLMLMGFFIYRFSDKVLDS